MITTEQLQNVANKLEVELAMVQAVTKIEARSSGIKNGLPVILFERHIFYRQLKKHGFDVEKLTNTYPDLINPTAGGYLGGARENYRLTLAKQIDIDSAIESASWGLFQIMGFHWQLLGYESAQQFEQQMTESEEMQLDAFYRFVTHKSNCKLLQAMKDKDFSTFAKLYNGPAYKKNNYDLKLKEAYENYAKSIKK
jgi:hypothetical protein